MRIAFFVNSIEGEHPRYTTTALALAALTRGHDICYLTPATSCSAPTTACWSGPGRSREAATRRSRPSTRRCRATRPDRDDRCPRDRRADAAQRSLAGRRRAALGGERRPHVRPAGGRPRRAGAERSRTASPLAQNKLYLQGFPEAVRPASLISKSIEEIRAFIDEQPGGVILKPLQGSGGKNVFKIGSSGDFEPQPDLRGGLGRGLPGCAELHSGGGGRRRPPLPDERRAASARRQVRRHAAGPCRGGTSLQHACSGTAGKVKLSERRSRRRRDGPPEAGAGRAFPGRSRPRRRQDP